MTIQRRTFRHETERRSWWIEVELNVLRTASSSDDEPNEWTERTRPHATPDAALAAANQLIAEQLADGFEEQGAKVATTSNETPLEYFRRLARVWLDTDSTPASSEWLERASKVPAPYLAQCHAKLEELVVSEDWRIQREVETWLRMQLPTLIDPLQLALRDPRFRVWSNVLTALEEVGPHRAELMEGTFISLIAFPPPPPYAGAHATPAHFRTIADTSFSTDALSQLGKLATHGDVNVATNAAFILAHSSKTLMGRSTLAALMEWNQSTGAHTLRDTVIEEAIQHLASSLKQPVPKFTRSELARLLALAQSQLPR